VKRGAKKEGQIDEEKEYDKKREGRNLLIGGNGGGQYSSFLKVVLNKGSIFGRETKKRLRSGERHKEERYHSKGEGDGSSLGTRASYHHEAADEKGAQE